MDEINPNWYQLADRQGKGATLRPGSLGGLAEARRANRGEFYTPDAVAKRMFEIVAPALQAASEHEHARCGILDNSIGTGRLIQFASPDAHAIYGIEINTEQVRALSANLEAAGFTYELLDRGMESVQIAHRAVSCALINPPFSLTLMHPAIAHTPGGTWGPYGQGTQAISHSFALQQALGAADLVVALLPTAYAKVFQQEASHEASRLRAIIQLPTRSFASEGTAVEVSLLVFGDQSTTKPVQALALEHIDDPLPDFQLRCKSMRHRPAVILRGVNENPSEPVITTPRTGDNRVRVTHSGRKITLLFADGMTEAKVMNALYVDRLPFIEGLRRPKGWRYVGQGKFDVEVYLLQPDPRAAFRAFLSEIADAGGEPLVDPGLHNYLEKRIRRHARDATPFRLTIASTAPTRQQLMATPKRHLQINPNAWGSAVLPKGVPVTLNRDGEQWTYTHPASSERLVLSDSALRAAFEVSERSDESEAGWRVVHPGRAVAFPDLAKALRARMRASGVDQIVSWDYQQEDLIQLLMSRGAVCGHEMGLGKTRMAIALCLLGGKHNLICIEPHLRQKFMSELADCGVASSDYQLINTPGDLGTLRRINVISYHQLRQPVHPAAPKRTWAKALRHRIATLVADEAHLLRHEGTAQSRAVLSVAARRTYGMTGTPIANYPRDALRLMAWANGNATARQPYGLERPHLTAELSHGHTTIERGLDAFRKTFVTTAWVTREFENGLEKGAKREIPQLANPDQFRSWLGPLLLRRTREEPEVAQYIHIPKAEHRVIRVEWDEPHLALFLTTAEHFKEWWYQQRRLAHLENRGVNLIALLARLGALQRVTNAPQMPIPGLRRYGALTSKQRAAIDRARFWIAQDRKVLIYVENPTAAEVMAREARKQGVPTITITGKQSIRERTHALNADFRAGDVPLAIATLGTVQTGLDIPEASVGIFAARAWTAKTERQAAQRMMRVQQRHTVQLEYLELPGSCDTYQHQMVTAKGAAMDSGIDHQDSEASEFIHLEQVIARFVEDLATLRGQTPQDLRKELTHAA